MRKILASIVLLVVLGPPVACLGWLGSGLLLDRVLVDAPGP